MMLINNGPFTYSPITYFNPTQTCDAIDTNPPTPPVPEGVHPPKHDGGPNVRGPREDRRARMARAIRRGHVTGGAGTPPHATPSRQRLAAATRRAGSLASTRTVTSNAPAGATSCRGPSNQSEGWPANRSSGLL